jgi:AraC-like DNA-binding protein
MKLVVDFILVAGLVISLIILFFHLKAKQKELHQKILILFFTFLFFVNLHAYGNLHSIDILYKISFLFDFTVFWFLGPLLLLYIKAVFENKKGLIKNNLVHFIPCVFFAVSIGIPIVFSLFFDNFQPNYLLYLDKNQFGIIILRNVYFAYYIKRSLDILSTYKIAIKLNYSNISNMDIRWIQNLLYGCLTFVSIDIVTRIFDFFYIGLGYITMFSIILFVAYLGYYGINQSKILLPGFLIDKKEKEKTNSLSNYNDEDITGLLNKLKAELVENKLYLDENLDLKMLSQQLNITDKKLSTLLNVHLDTTFYEYINHYRVDAVKKMITSPENDKYTLLAIAHECGFNSKASFNRVFKKETGLSPSQYRKENML